MTNLPLFSVLETQLESLSSRDRKLLAGLVFVICMLVVMGTSWWVRGSLNDRASRVIMAKQDLQTAYALRSEYDRVAGIVATAEERLASSPPQQLGAFVEALTSKHSIREGLRGVKEQGSTEDLGVKVTTYEVEFRKVALEPLLKVLLEMESSNYPLRIEDARFKVVYFKRERLMDLTLEIVVHGLGGKQ
jgi:type II secretory pathway component PulM